MTEKLTISIHVANAKEVEADCALLTQLAQSSAKFRQRLLGLGNFSSHIRCVDAERDPAGHACEFWIRLEYSDALADLVLAARAGDFNGE